MSFTNPYPASRLTVDTTNSLANGLVGFWPLTDGGSSTTAKDITSNANDGTQSGGVSWDSTAIGTAASFDGSNDYFDLGDNYDFGDGTTDSAFSISGWMYLDTIPASNKAYTVVSKTSENAGTTQTSSYLLNVNSSGSLVFALYDLDSATNIYATSTASSVTTGQWYHLVGTYTGSGSQTGLQVYIDGVNAVSTQSGSGSYVAMHNSTETAKIGCRFLNNSTYGSFSDGYIQNVRIYDRALSATEVATLYNRPWEATNFGDLWPYSPPAPTDATLSTDTAATSLMSGCVGWWLLTETDDYASGAADISGNANNGTQSGGVLSDVSRLGGVASFDDTDDRINVGDVYDPGTGSLTISMWFKKDDTGSTEKLIAYGTSSGSAGANWVHLGWSAANVFQFGMDDGSAAVTANSAYTYDDGEWHHVVCTYDTADIKVYIDGVLDVSSSASTLGSVTDATQKWKIGAIWTGSAYDQFFGGDISNVRIWNRALTADEITLLFERPFEGITYGDAFHYDPPTPASLTPLTSDSINNSQVGWWPLTETDDYASGAADISGNSNNGTQSGGVLSEVSPLGGVASFDGVDDIIDASAYTIASTSSMTMAGWIRYTSTVGFVSVLNICNDGGGTTAQYTRNIVINSSGNATCNVQSGTVIAQAVGSTVFDIGEWYFVVGTFDKVGTSYDVEIFVNGVSEATASGTGSELTPYTKTCIGGARRYNGAITAVEPCEIHNVRLWNRILTSQEIWDIYQNPWLGSAYQASAAAVYYNYILRSKRFRRLS